ncbi:hypothetical protein OH76DRAFT_723500 [Lentinus brumalis]|uniref:Uncharacterized protein n=1 Tax=Lentinus brumalis TaxID=2498619 RepID=A0A371D4Z8_9APHY|nr:hypothetical protein OH76DRAFT_723500 [Polyporus brumalis]
MVAVPHHGVASVSRRQTLSYRHAARRPSIVRIQESPSKLETPSPASGCSWLPSSALSIDVKRRVYSTEWCYSHPCQALRQHRNRARSLSVFFVTDTRSAVPRTIPLPNHHQRERKSGACQTAAKTVEYILRRHTETDFDGKPSLAIRYHVI